MPGGRQIIGGEFQGRYVRDTPAAPWRHDGSLNAIRAFARDAGGRTYAAGLVRLIAYSDDDGTSWQRRYLPCATSCSFATTNVAVTATGALVAADDDGVPYRSIDRGATWAYATGAVPTQYAFGDIAMRADGTLFAVGNGPLATSIDDGTSWQTPAHGTRSNRWRRTRCCSAATTACGGATPAAAMRLSARAR